MMAKSIKYNHNWYPYFKRFLDCILSLLLLLLCTPIGVLVILPKLITRPYRPFFVQTRLGKNCKTFKIFKLRTLYPDTELPTILTKYNQFLRASGLDELPQLINILIGNMSFVGPRPLLPEYLTQFNEIQKLRMKVLPGLTGYAQVHCANPNDWTCKFKFDLKYIESYSLLLDLQIGLQTVYTLKKRIGNKENNIKAISFLDWKKSE